MKKITTMVMGLILLACLFSGCASPENTSQSSPPESTSITETGTNTTGDDAASDNGDYITLVGNVLTVDMNDEDYYMHYVLTIDHYKVINPGEEGNEYGDSPIIAFWYDTAFEKGCEPMSVLQSWRWVLNVVQDTDSKTVNQLEMVSCPDAEISEYEEDAMKDGATVRGAVAYKLSDTTTPLEIIGEMNGREVGRQTVEITE